MKVKLSPEDMIAKDLEGGSTLIIYRGIAYITQAIPLSEKCLVCIAHEEKAIPLGVTETFDIALSYIQTLDSEKLIEVA